MHDLIHVVRTYQGLIEFLATFLCGGILLIINTVTNREILAEHKMQTLYIEELAASSEDIAHIEEDRG